MIIKYLNDSNNEVVLLPLTIYEAMQQYCAEHLPKEFGGILTGIDHVGIKIIIDIETPNRFTNSRTGFVRYADDLNNYLATVYSESKGTIQYLGEWHSHPEGSTVYSGNDAKSMLELAKDNASKQPSPILIILGAGRTAKEISVYQCDGEELVKLIKHE